jgi:hypothetical protein
MAIDLAEPYQKWENLAPPPRQVSLGVWCNLLGGPVTLAGSGVFAFGMIFALLFGPAANPVGAWRLSQRRQVAQGWLEKEEKTHFSEGGGDGDPGTPVYRYDYTFALPDGTPVHGRSYSVGQRFQVPPPGQPAPRVAVTVEYDPEHPATSRIQGTRTSPFSPWVLFVVLFPAVGLLIAVGGLLAGWRRGRLLRDGELVSATVTTCRFASGEDSTYLPVAEYKRRLAEARALAASRPFVLLIGGFVRVWTILAVAVSVFGVIVCVALLVMLLFVFPGQLAQQGFFVLGVLGFLALWLTMSWFMVRAGRRGCRAIGRQDREPAPQPPVSCDFEFHLPDGERVQSRAPGQIAVLSEDEPPQPALYDPLRPRQALLLSSLGPAVRLGPFGAWEADAAAAATGRLTVSLMLLVGPVVIGALLL